ncbi:CAP domain-containing protein [Actinomadura algeriensis]|nr:CAP domain-containing protein [Actinomadura algeriensis]
MRDQDGHRPGRASDRVVVWTAVGAAGLLVTGAIAGTIVGVFQDDPGGTLAGAESTPTPTPSATRPAGAASPEPSATPSPTKAKTKTEAKETREPVQKDSRPPARKPTPTPKADEPDPPKRTTAPAGGTTAARVVALVNAERAEKGCGPVRSNAQLTRAAQGHSADMAARGYFAHTSPDGDDPGDRITAAGYRWRSYGENIAKGQSSPESVMRSWMNSPGHRANILNCGFDEIGVGVVTSGGPYWTQAFGSR